ncbi:hypothetical protein T484DRAFT_3101810 [Baffinella frigidus]|nr:hypothetical protein T484DRAFT_3101810 [Cryptophyta sp. CCMP2293]
MDEGESFAACAVREVREEIGFDISKHVSAKLSLTLRPYEGDRWRRASIRLFIVPGIPENTKFASLSQKEVRSIEWFSLDSLCDLAALTLPHNLSSHHALTYNLSSHPLVAPSSHQYNNISSWKNLPLLNASAPPTQALQHNASQPSAGGNGTGAERPQADGSIGGRKMHSSVLLAVPLVRELLQRHTLLAHRERAPPPRGSAAGGGAHNATAPGKGKGARWKPVRKEENATTLQPWRPKFPLGAALPQLSQNRTEGVGQARGQQKGAPIPAPPLAAGGALPLHPKRCAPYTLNPEP